jgi:deoxyribodipyrimidine photo-lyase
MPIEPSRIRVLNQAEPRPGGAYVLYWMQQSQRAEFNPALEYAVHRANELKLPLVVVFGLMDDYPEANLRHYHFLLQGLADVQRALAGRKITFVVHRGSPDDVALRVASEAALLVCDRGYLRHQRQWRDTVAREARCPVVQAEGDVVVPVELVSDKQESAARTIRPKITKHLDRFLVPLPTTTLRNTTSPSIDEGEDLSDVDQLAGRLQLDTSVRPVPWFTGGTTAGKQTLRRFLADHFTDYAKNRNQPQTDDVSHMSKYLHYGQLSPVWIALEIRRQTRGGENREEYLAELIVRRELPMNYVFYARRYDSYAGLPAWARRTLVEHAGDERTHVYTRGQLEQAETHDPYWNAAMRELKHTGYMHSHMRMYGGKKILEWSDA